MEIETTRFGKILIEEDKIITFVRSILGFPSVKRFVLIPHRKDSPFMWLQSLERPDLAFVVIPPGLFLADYVFDLPDSVQKDLEMERPQQALVLVLVSISRENQKPRVTANLLGPIVINTDKRLASQVVLNPNKYPVQFPLANPKPVPAKENLEDILQQAANCR